MAARHVLHVTSAAPPASIALPRPHNMYCSLPPATSQVGPDTSRARPSPKQVFHVLSHRCQRTTIIEQYTLRSVHPICNRIELHKGDLSACIGQLLFPVVIPFVCPAQRREFFCMEWSYFFSHAHPDASKYRSWKQFLVSSTRSPLHRRDYLHVHISGRHATVSESAMPCRGYR